MKDFNKLKNGDYITPDLKIIEVIAEGGSATVYKCRNAKLESYKAVKVMKPEEQSMEERFITEAKVTANMNNTNIIQVHNVGRTTEELGECPYIEMEYVDGQDLGFFLDKSHSGRIPENAALALISILAKALNYAHSKDYTIYKTEHKGLVHRDIKPANVLISEHGDVKLTDFGIVKVHGLELHATTVNGFIGTSYYLSPEQIKCEKDIDGRTDIYSLGCLFYDILTGRIAYKIDNIGDLTLKKESDNYDKKLLKKCASKEVVKVVKKMMVGDRAKRYQSSEQLKVAIHEVLLKRGIVDSVEYFKEYVKSPDNPKYGSKSKTTRKISAFVFNTLMLFLLIMVVITYTQNNRKEKVELKKDIQQKESSNVVVSANNSVNKAIKFEKIKDDNQTQIKKSKKIRKTPKLRNENLKNKKFKTKVVVSKDVEISGFNKFQELYKKKEYASSRELLSNINVFEKSEIKVIIDYLKKGLNNGRYKIVNDIFKDLPIKDGYYHYLMGKTYFLLNDLQNAEMCYSNALQNKTVFISNNSKMNRVVFEMASINKKHYEKEKNEKTKNLYKKNLSLLIKISEDGDYYNKFAKKELERIK